MTPGVTLVYCSIHLLLQETRISIYYGWKYQAFKTLTTCITMPKKNF